MEVDCEEEEEEEPCVLDVESESEEYTSSWTSRVVIEFLRRTQRWRLRLSRDPLSCAAERSFEWAREAQ